QAQSKSALHHRFLPRGRPQNASLCHWLPCRQPCAGEPGPEAVCRKPCRPDAVPCRPLAEQRGLAYAATMLRKLYDWTLAKAAHPHAEWWLAVFSFVEASFFPIPPHPLLGLMCLAEPQRAIRFAVIATLSSVAGGLLGYAIGWVLYDTVGTELLALLGMTDSFPVAACYLREYGAESIMIK